MPTRLELIGTLIATIVAVGCCSRSAASEWTAKQSMPTARWGLTASVIDGRIYAVGGSPDANSAWFSTVEVYDPGTDSWSTRTPLPYARAVHAAAAVNGKLYVMGGAPALSASTSTVDEYDPATDRWSAKAAMPRDRAYHCAAAVGGKIYVFGGINYLDPTHWGDVGPVDVYDPLTDTWTTKGPMRTPRGCTSACVCNGRIYIFVGLLGGPGGAASDGLPVTTADVYDPLTDTWTPIASLPEAHGYPGVCSVGGKIYVIGSGCFFGTSSSRVDVYDPISNQWSLGPELSKGKYSFGADVIGATIFIVGGTEKASWPIGISKVEADTSSIPLDTTAPELLYVGGSPSMTQVKVWFSEPVDPASARHAANYRLSNGVTITAAAVGAQPADNTVLLTTSAQPEGATLMVTVSGVMDLAGNVIAANTAKEFGSYVFVPGQVLHEYWRDLNPQTLDRLVADPRFPLTPSWFTWEPRFEFPPDGASGYDEIYGNKLSTWFVPETTDDYVFFTWSAKASELYLSTDWDPANKKLIAEGTSPSDPRLWSSAQQRSAPVHLEGAKKYYLESLHVEEQGADHVSATFIKAGASDPVDGAAPMLAGNRIGYYLDPNLELKFATEPVDQPGALPPPGLTEQSNDFKVNDAGFDVINTDPEPPGPWHYDRSKGCWVADGASPECGGPYASELLSPDYTLSQSGEVLLSFSHRYSFEHRWDGGVIAFCLNGSPSSAVAAIDFTMNGYAPGWLIGMSHNGQRTFTGKSPGYDEQQFITSQVQLGALKQGDNLSLRFIAAWDQCSTAPHPNWEIASVKLDVLPELPTPAVFEAQATASVYGQWRQVSYQWQRQDDAVWVDIPDATSSAWRFFPAPKDFQAAFRLKVSVPEKSLFSRSIKLVSEQTPPPSLAITLADGKIWLTFTGCLKTAANVAGPYLDVSGAVSPYPVSGPNATAFFRCTK